MLTRKLKSSLKTKTTEDMIDHLQLLVILSEEEQLSNQETGRLFLNGCKPMVIVEFSQVIAIHIDLIGFQASHLFW